MSASILVVCPFGLDGGLVSRAKAIGASCNAALHVLCRSAEQQRAALFGAEHLHLLPDGFHAADDSSFAAWLAERIYTWGCNIILAPAGIQLRNVMPMLAWRLGAGLTADCSIIDMDENGRLIQTRPAFGNSLVAGIVTVGSIQMATVSPGAYRAVPCPTAHTEVTRERCDERGARIKLLGFEPYPSAQPLSQADVIISGGRGIGSRENFIELTKLAAKLNAGIGASRGAVDAGFAPHSCQVGLTGATVHPKIYVAVGISGAVQHLAGMSGSETVIAVNSDPKAQIFDYADYGIVAGWRDAAEHITRIIESKI